MNGLLYLDNETLLIILESFGDYFKAMRFVLSFNKTFYGSIQHMHLLKISTEYTKDVHGEFWEVNGKFHREGDLPAAIYSTGNKVWYKNGKRHREGDLPAVIISCNIFQDEVQEWWVNGKRHREGDKPAITGNRQEWWVNDKRHHDGDLPAVIFPDNYRKEWHKNGKRHRDGGPAILMILDGIGEWYNDGEYYKTTKM